MEEAKSGRADPRSRAPSCFPLPSLPGATVAPVPVGSVRVRCFLTVPDSLYYCPIPVPSGRDMSVPGPPSLDGVLAGPPDGLEAGGPTPGTCCGAGRGGRDPSGWVSGPPRGNKVLSAAAARRLCAQR